MGFFQIKYHLQNSFRYRASFCRVSINIKPFGTTTTDTIENYCRSLIHGYKTFYMTFEFRKMWWSPIDIGVSIVYFLNYMLLIVFFISTLKREDILQIFYGRISYVLQEVFSSTGLLNI